jgi:hypothetical protein
VALKLQVPILGAFPLVTSGLEHWRDVAKVSGFFWRMRKEYSKCRYDVQFHEIWYKRNLEELLLPIINDMNDLNRLINNPGGKDWASKVLQARLEKRLHKSYNLYMEIICEMNETTEELKKEISFDDVTIQSKLQLKPKEVQQCSGSQTLINSTLSSARSRWDYETFRLRLSLRGTTRDDLFSQLKKCIEGLEKPLNMSDRTSAFQVPAAANVKQNTLEMVFKKAWKSPTFSSKPCKIHGNVLVSGTILPIFDSTIAHFLSSALRSFLCPFIRQCTRSLNGDRESYNAHKPPTANYHKDIHTLFPYLSH